MGPRFDRVSPRRVGIVLALGLALLAYAPSLAHASGYSWQDGPAVESSDTNCVTNDSEQEAGAWLSYYIDPSAPPQTGTVYYVGIDVAGIGDPCVGMYADMNLELPPGTTPSVSGTTPVKCMLKFPTSSSFRQDTEDCPQSLTEVAPGEYSVDPIHFSPPFWPLPQGGIVEVWVPVVSTLSGELTLSGVVTLADGQSEPTLQPSLQMIVDSSSVQTSGSGDNQIGVTYNDPSLTSNQETGPNEPTTVVGVGYVDNYSNPGSVVGVLNYAGSAGNCNTVGTHIFTTSPAASLQNPNTQLTATFTGLYPDVAYCWRLVATVTGNGLEAGTYDGNWEYFVTNGPYISGIGAPPAANPPNVSVCNSNTGNCTNFGCGGGSTCGGTGGVPASTTEALDLTFSGSGSGNVTGSADLSCTASCTTNFSSGATVTLTAHAGTGSSFYRWSGCASTNGATCTVTMSAAESVSVEFLREINIQSRTLSVALTGPAGSGFVNSTPSGISCPGTCSASFDADASVTLTPVAAPGYSVHRLDGCGCSGTGTCSIRLALSESVTANFAPNTPGTAALTVSLTGTGSGKVTSTSGISCPSTCSHSYSDGATDTLTATAASGSKFTGWSGGGCSGTGTCKVTVNADENVVAEFTLSQPPTVKPSCSLSIASSRILLKRERHRSGVLDSLALKVQCTQTITVRLSGKVTEQLTRRKLKHFTLRPLTVSLSARTSRVVSLKLPSGAIKGLRSHRKESIALTLAGSDTSGSASAHASVGRLHTSG